MPGGQRRRGHGGGRGWASPIRGFLEPCLLLVLKRGRNHGYDLKNALAPFGLGEINPSLVYRALREMEAQGLVVSEWDTETTAGPARRVYQITDEGDLYLDRWAQGLRSTDRVLHHFLEAVEQDKEENQA